MTRVIWHRRQLGQGSSSGRKRFVQLLGDLESHSLLVTWLKVDPDH